MRENLASAAIDCIKIYFYQYNFCYIHILSKNYINETIFDIALVRETEIIVKITKWDAIKKNCETDLVRASRFTRCVLPRKAVLLFYFNTAKETKSEKSFWRFASRRCLPTKERD